MLNEGYAAQCSFRGYNEYVEKLVAQEQLDSKPCKISPEISEVSVFFKELYRYSEMYELIKRHPYVKATGFIEDFSLDSVFVFYSESGSADIDEYRLAGAFDPRSDGGSGRWAGDHVVTADLQTRFIDASTGSYIYVDYRFPFLKQWSKFDFAVEENGKTVACREKADFVYHNGEYINESSADSVEIVEKSLSY